MGKTSAAARKARREQSSPQDAVLVCSHRAAAVDVHRQSFLGGCQPQHHPLQPLYPAARE